MLLLRVEPAVVRIYFYRLVSILAMLLAAARLNEFFVIDSDA
jgi:hypothetical protein